MHPFRISARAVETPWKERRLLSFITVNLIETSGAARNEWSRIGSKIQSRPECTKRSPCFYPFHLFLISRFFPTFFSPLLFLFPLFSFLSPPLCPSSFHFDDDLARSPIMTNDVEDIISRNEPVFVLIAPCYLSLKKGRKETIKKETSGSEP